MSRRTCVKENTRLGPSTPRPAARRGRSAAAVRSARRAWWQPAGGGIEPGEEARAAALREVAEETGLQVVQFGAESGLTASATVDLAEWRWWTLSELQATSERLVPSDLAARLGDLLAHGAPARPIDVGL